MDCPWAERSSGGPRNCPGRRAAGARRSSWPADIRCRRCVMRALVMRPAMRPMMAPVVQSPARMSASCRRPSRTSAPAKSSDTRRAPSVVKRGADRVGFQFEHGRRALLVMRWAGASPAQTAWRERTSPLPQGRGLRGVSDCRAAGPWSWRRAGTWWRPSAPCRRRAGPLPCGRFPATASGSAAPCSRRPSRARRGAASISASETSMSQVPLLRSIRTLSPFFRMARPPPAAASGEALRIEGEPDVPDWRPSPTQGSERMPFSSR